MARDRFRLAFEDPELERGFLADVIREAPSRARVGLAIGVALFMVSAGAWAAVVVPDQLRVTLSLMYGVGAPVCVLGVCLTWLPGYGRWVWPRAVLLIAMGASFIAVQAFHPATPHWFSFGIVASLVLYVYLVARIRLTSMLAVTLTVSVTYLIVVARQLEARLTMHYGFLLSLMNAFGTWASYSAERYRRHEWLQAREIERQKETIAHERARSEALLRSELRHQVAERSRELGDVLARVGAAVASVLPAPGDRFDMRYRVVRALGEGGMGAVFEVERLTDAQRLALKVVTGRISGAAAARFAREAEIGARVRHENLIAIVDVGIAEGGAPFLVMELVSGGSLEGLRARFGDVVWGVGILRQIALGLAALHDAGVVHRDLKPANVLLDGGGEGSPLARISDFGISRFGRLDEAAVIDPEGPTLGASTPKKQDLTGTGVLLGTPLYMAPEAARGGRTLDAAADVFAFGIVAYEVLTGRAPFDTPAVLLALGGMALPAPPPIDETSLEGAARDAVLACLAEDPRARPSARQVYDALA